MNRKRRFEPGEYAQIGPKYVYALQDPADQRIFYVGQGTRNRVFEHLDRAEILLQSRKRLTPKFEAIHAIWSKTKDVQLIILAGGLSDREADLVESATLDALNLSSNGELTNAIAAPHSSMVRVEDLAASAYQYVNPGRRYLKILLFPAQRRQKNKDVYERCRRSWKVAKKHRAIGTEEQASHAVAIVGGVSVGAYRITKWNRLEDDKWEFEGIPHAELEKLNWRTIIKPAMGYWQRGNYLIVEFDGAGLFRIVRGSRKRLWMSCVEQSEVTVTTQRAGFLQPDQFLIS
ncbi:hypothetical protein FBX97_5005 [Herbaspirillum sp. SJZ107]|nr:hypothetical protein FBX97_5005 [Herbaspirillum sp. SJZ107]